MDTDLPSFSQYLESMAVDEEVIHRWTREPSWMSFDAELGYTLANSMPAEGIDGCGTITTIDSTGARRRMVYAEDRPRINSYGNSFTHCQQVSDGETWQEYLGGHLGEPIGNFGVGGYGVYQAFRRLLREEQTDHGADYLIFYVWGNDSVRSLTRCFRAFVGPRMDVLYAGREAEMFHGNPWSNIEFDPVSKAFVERPNLLADEADLLALSDPAWMRDNLRDDVALQLSTFADGLQSSLDIEVADSMATALGRQLSWKLGDPEALRGQAKALLDTYGNVATLEILARLERFAGERDKRLLVVINDGDYRALPQMREGVDRFDQELLDGLSEASYPVIDMTAITFEEYVDSGIPWQSFKDRHYVNGTGHFSPAGNHHFAYAIKDGIVSWLEPKPRPYESGSRSAIDYDSYMKRS